MQPSTRQQELDRAYQSRPRRGHVPQISISDDTHHVTEAMSSYYGNSPTDGDSSRPLSFVSSPAEKYDTIRNPEYFSAKNASPPRKPLGRRESNERVVTPPGDGSGKTKGLHRTGSIGAENMNGQQSPPLSRQPSTRSNGDTAVQHFPLNDIDYESSPAAVAQELSNLQAIRRMSMNVDTADPDLPSFGGMPTVAPSATADEDDPSKLFWVPARLHPELAPKEFKTFVEERVDRVRRTSGSDDSLSPDNLDRSGSTSGGGLRRKKSMLSRQINTRDDYQDGAERLERKRSRGAPKDLQPKLSELEELPEDAAELIQRISLDTERRSLDSGVEIPAKEDMPILPPGGPKLKRSTHTTYRRGSQRKGERAPYSSRRVISRRSDDQEEAPLPSPIKQSHDEPAVGLSRANTTEPITPPKQSLEQESRPVARRGHSAHESDTGTHRDAQQERAHAPPLPPVPSQHQRQPERPQERRSSDTPPTSQVRPRPSLDDEPDAQRHPNAPQQKQFHSRIAAPGRTTAQLPGYKNANPLPNIVETLPDGTKVTVPNPTPQHPNQQQPQHAPPQQPSPQVQQQQPPQTQQQQQQQQPQAPSPQQQFPERKSSHESSRQRGGAHMRPAPGQQRTATASQTLDDISSHPSPLPGSGATRTDALTMVPTFEEKKSDKKEGGRKSSWKWILGNDDDDKEKKHSKEDKKGSEAAKLTKAQDKTRLDLLQSSIDGTTPGRGRESVVLNRDDIKLDDERKKESKKASSKAKASKEDKEAKEPGLLSAIFGGGKKKSSDTDLKAKKRKSERDPSPEPPARVLKPDIDYNWTRFSILEERAIYRMAHIKLANPKRALYSQVLLSNFMYSYLAKVQMMHPQMQIPASPQQKAAQQRKKEQEEARAREKANQPSEYSEYQKWQELLQVQSNKEAASADAKRQEEQRQQPQQQDRGANPGAPRDHDGDSSNHDDHDSASTSEWPDFRSSGSSYNQPQHQHQQQQRSKPSMNGSTAAAGGKGYSVSSTHDYLGYGSNRNNNSNSSSRHQQSSQGEKGFQQDLWDDDKEGDLW